MEKILNNPKFNVYGGLGMLNKYIYMKREDSENKFYYLYKINNIINDVNPIKYECIKMYILVVPKNTNKSITVKDSIKTIELTNNDILYQISIDEYLGIFKVFVECQGTTNKITDNIFEK